MLEKETEQAELWPRCRERLLLRGVRRPARRLGPDPRASCRGKAGAELATLAQFMENGDLESVLDRTYPLSETAAAIAYSEEGRARGKIIIEIPEK
jgi:NADPH:quinone reductase-like Zn-dependent oxidoreductase